MTRIAVVNPVITISYPGSPYADGTVANVDTIAQAQTAYDAAPSDTHLRILFSRGGSTQGQMVLGRRSGGTEIGYQGAALPANTRIPPAKAASVYNLKRLIGPGSGDMSVIKRSPTAGSAPLNLHLNGLYATTANATNWNAAVVEFGLDGITLWTQQPRRLLITQCCVATGTGSTARAALGAQIAGLESRYNWYYCYGYGGQNEDSQAIRMYQGAGKARFYHDFLCGSHEIFATGGTGISPAPYVLSDVTLDGCHLFRPLSWRGVRPCKEVMEMKLGVRFLIKNSHFQNSWVENQAGIGLGTWSIDATNGSQAFAATTDVELRDSWLKNVGVALNVVDAGFSQSYYSRRLKYDNVAVTGLGDPTTTSDPTTGSTSNHFCNIYSNWNVTPGRTSNGGFPSDVTIQHVTGLARAGGIWLQGTQTDAFDRLQILDNVGGVLDGYYVINNAGVGQVAWDAMNAHGNGAFAGNLLAKNLFSDVNPATNRYASTIAGLGLTNAAAPFDNALALADLDQIGLAAGSLGKNYASDGTDAGCDTVSIRAALSDVIAADADLPT